MGLRTIQCYRSFSCIHVLVNLPESHRGNYQMPFYKNVNSGTFVRFDR